MALKKSPLAPLSFPVFPEVNGVRFATGHTGMKYKDRDDLLLVELSPGTTVAGVFTKNAMPGAPVDWGRKILPNGVARGLVVNAGIANVFTGSAGKTTVEETAKTAGKLLNANSNEIYIASTGVIGDPVPTEKITELLPELRENLSAGNGQKAAASILTTDTFAKGAVSSGKIQGKDVTITGFAKGSGMIAPDMATMLAFIFTDAAIPAPILQQLLLEINENSFNCVTVDSDTSTSDTVLLFATGAAENAPPVTADDEMLSDFIRALYDVMSDLAQQVARDGEGASKFITIKVTGATSDASAKKIALAIANSPLVKTAIAGEDANWGRVIMAVGKSGERADRDKMRLMIGGILIAQNGHRYPDYNEEQLTPHMKGREIVINVDVAVGDGSAFAWTCDLTHGYIDINADYRS
ncbi:bifunctional glutamate N-acetyltransferase/amino-acid acetyltransferase ArgJ [Sneathiella marina]|uniref:Arginine biosynthesis bifunctional protein ArgJ n=1 Tax=Sneathiella marina TaxID=2950108 RepID=A0ABY4W0L2_9PROT|nr:bifunctional glutamate N-acetyltransferase/amino-acid acetyltransferase ArgJ [Sneathiella marina]USG60703.1 bifunctional glutamate N-acetyltransferase/amino-acid acetyltransferase ArgJ [Sneathiella marina]